MIEYTNHNNRYNKPRFSLDENCGGHRQKKLTCPRCGRKSFVPVLDWQTEQPIDAEVLGICDHAQSCCYSDTDVSAYWRQHPDKYEALTGYAHPSARQGWQSRDRYDHSEFLAIASRLAREWDEEEGIAPTEDNAEMPTAQAVQDVAAVAELAARIVEERIGRRLTAFPLSDDKLHTRQGKTRTGGRYGANSPRYVKPSAIQPAEMLRTLGGYDINRLAVWLRDAFAPLLTPDEVTDVLRDYAVGTVRYTDWDCGYSPMYWQIDAEGLVRTGKAIGYSTDGKRIREPRPLMRWAHSPHKHAAEADGEKFQMQQCWYGAHRLQRQGQAVWLCEGEKGALIAALALRAVDAELYRQIVPVACGGCAGFNPIPEKLNDPWDGLQSAKGRSVVVFPDSGKQSEWAAKAEALDGYAADVRVSRWCEPGAVPYEVHDGDGFDDVILRCIAEGGDLAALLLAATT